jgi:ubiquinone/menaquinone biosynthesis C-methylase UbiE
MNFDRLSRTYLGALAEGYDGARARLAKWSSEQRIVEDILATLPPGSSIIDIPVGTGRFVESYYRMGLAATGMDISPDMIMIAARKAQKIGFNMPFYLADIRDINVADGVFDAAVCTCFLNWLDIDDAKQAFSELVRIARKSLIVSIRHYATLEELQPMTKDGFLQWALQISVRTHKALNRGGLRIHEEADVFNMFWECGLDLKQRTRVVPRKYGTDYYIYTLEKPQ